MKGVCYGGGFCFDKESCDKSPTGRLDIRKKGAENIKKT